MLRRVGGCVCSSVACESEDVAVFAEAEPFLLGVTDVCVPFALLDVAAYGPFLLFCSSVQAFYINKSKAKANIAPQLQRLSWS